MVGGIYQIKNTVNGKCYIGRTKNFKRRFAQYEYDFRERKIKHINEHLLNSMISYGFDVFDFNILEYCNEDVQVDRENYWMVFFNSIDSRFGYNLRQDINNQMVTHPLTSEKISNRLREEWASGLRDGHSEKLKIAWGRRSREDQSNLMSKNLTKWVYIVDCEILSYRELKARKLHGSLGKFAKYKVNKIIFKGVTIERVKIENQPRDTC